MGYRLAQRILPVLLLCAAATALAEPVDMERAKRVCVNWLAYLQSSPLEDPEAANPRIFAVQSITAGDTLLGWHFELRPKGYVIVPARTEMPPVFSSSRTATWPSSDENPFLRVARDVLASRVRHLKGHDAPQGGLARDCADHDAHRAWVRYDESPADFVERLDSGIMDEVLEVGPLLGSRWRQDWPFNLDCPMGASGRTFVGCMGTATAQIVRYHQWPPVGSGIYGYQWDGDDCDESPSGEWLEVDMGNAYRWDDMPDDPGWFPTPEQEEALAEFNYEVAVACRMDFSSCGSEASISLARAALVNHFFYQPYIREVTRFRYTDAAWFAEIQDDIDQGLPILYSTIMHAMVCDGWREVDGMQQIHLNYGWGGASDNWYTLDDIETSSNPWAERMLLDTAPDASVVFPVDVQSFEGEPGPDGVTILWESEGAGVLADFWIYRTGGDRSCIPMPLTLDPLSGQSSYEYLDTTALAGEYRYWLKAVPPGGDDVWFGPVTTSVVSTGVEGVSVAGLATPSPNPANPRTRLSFSLAHPGPARLRVLDARGRAVRTLLDADLPAGDHAADWDGRTDDGRVLASGSYFVRLESGGGVWTEKVVLAR